jgi:hypothetical protein
VQAGAARDEATDRPPGEAEQPQLLAGGRIHREPVGIVGIPLRLSHLVGVAVTPDRALAQEPVRRQPRARERDRRPPRIGGQDCGGREPADHLDHPARDEIHRDRQRRAGHAEVEVARDRQVVGERRILEVTHARRTHTGLGEPVIQPRGRAVAEVGARRLMDRAQHLKQHEHSAGKPERAGEHVAALHGADEHAHRDRERRRQEAPEEEDDPPGGGETGGRLRQDGEELPFFAVGQAGEHDRILPENPSRLPIHRSDSRRDAIPASRTRDRFRACTRFDRYVMGAPGWPHRGAPGDADQPSAVREASPRPRSTHQRRVVIT